MSQKKAKGRKPNPKRRPNPGWFKRGLDDRRHPLDRQDCRKGFRVTVTRYPHLLDWVMGRFLAGRDRRRKELAEIPW